MKIDKSKYTNRLLASDIEAKGFYEEVHTSEDVWCFCTEDVDSGEVFLFHDYPEFDGVKVVDHFDNKEYTIPVRSGTLVEGARFWYMAGANGSKLIVHNAGSYDKPLVEKIWPKCKIPLTSWHDTYIQSKMQWFDRPTPKGAKGPHGLDAWGKRQGINKPAVKDWTTMDAFKLHRCLEDCSIQAQTYRDLEEEKRKLIELGLDFDEAWLIENEYRMDVTQQEINGALVDKPHMERCVVDLDEKLDVGAKEIEPLLPPSLDIKGTRISRREMAEKFGYKRLPEDEYVEATVKGERVLKVKKDYYSPSINFHRTIKGNLYSGFNISCGESPKFVKKKELTDWIKANYPDDPPKEWDIEKEETEVKVLNKTTCTYFGVRETDTDFIAGPHTRVEFVQSTMSQSEVVKGYLIRYCGWKDAFEWNLKKDHNKQSIRAEADTVISYPKRAHPDHQMHILVKKGQPLLSSPKLSEEDFEYLPDGVGKSISDYNSYMHRRRFISNPKDPENKGLMSYIRPDGRVGCGVNNFNTATSRSTQYKWVNAPSESALYGEEIRKIIIAPEGRKLVGTDMKSAQLAIAAYYANNSEYYEAVASGQEVEKDAEGNEIYIGQSAHCHSARNFGMVTQEEFERAKATQDPELLHSIMLRRKGSKAASFGVIFGCAGKLLAKMLGIPESQGNQKKDNFLNQMGLAGVAAWLEGCKTKYKRGKGWYIPVPMGYWVFCKSDHKSINYLIQSTEAICQKLACNYFNRHKEGRGITSSIKVLDQHDENLHECDEDETDKVGKLTTEAYKYASDEVYKWHMANPDKFPNQGSPTFAFNLDGGYKVGDNYLDTH